jgi:hypothetical protein
MSIGFDDEYNKKLRKKLMEFDNPIQANRAQPEMFFRQAQSDFILPYSKPSYPTLALALKAERQISRAQGQYDMEGEGLGDVFKGATKAVKSGATKAVKGVKKSAKSVEKGVKSTAKKVSKEADKFAKSKAGRELGRIAKDTGSFTLDLAEKSTGAMGAAAGVAAATALGQPELAPVFAAIGSKAASELGKSGRKAIKEKTGLGMKRPSKWIQFVKEYAKENNLSYKDAMKQGKSSYKK